MARQQRTQQRGFTRSQQVELTRINARTHLWSKGMDLLKWPLIVIASWIPIEACHAIIHDLAGKTTVLDANVVTTVSLSASIVTSVGWAQSAARSRLRKRSLERGRSRSDELEAKILE